MSGIFLIFSTFTASSLEVVEVMAIIFGVGATRGWRATIIGIVAGLGILAVLVVALGAALTQIPISYLRIFVGALLLIFGMQWLVKGVARIGKASDLLSPGGKEAVPGAAKKPKSQGFDWTAFVLALKGVILEGLEVTFIVVTFGAEAQQLWLAALSALGAIVIIGGIGLIARTWIERVPKPWLRYAVGIMLTSFGTFWACEGLGVAWPGSDASILGILAVYIAISLGYIWLIRGGRFPGLQPASQG